MDYVIEIMEASMASRAGELNALLAALSASAVPLTEQQWAAVIEARDTVTVVAKGPGGRLVGMAAICRTLLPTGTKWWIEDVVVDPGCRGCGLGRRLVQTLIDHAISHGGGTVMLTSRPSREAANALYRSMGFERKETNVYRMKL